MAVSRNDNEVAQMLSTLARVDERTLSMQKDIVSSKTDTTAKVDEIKDSISGIKKSLNEDFVRKESFTPVQRIVYGLVSIILTAVTMAIIGFVILK